MNDLNECYSQLLTVGFVVLKQAINAKDQEWIDAEVEYLHNIPSLIDEPSVERHRHFWFVERDAYMKWVLSQGSKEAKSRMATFHQALWDQMEPVVLERLSDVPQET